MHESCMTRVCFVKIMIIPGLHFHCVSFAHSYHLISFLTFTDEIDKRISIFLICIYLFDSHYVELSVCSLQVNKPRHLRYHLHTTENYLSVGYRYCPASFYRAYAATRATRAWLTSDRSR